MNTSKSADYLTRSYLLVLPHRFCEEGLFEIFVIYQSVYNFLTLFQRALIVRYLQRINGVKFPKIRMCIFNYLLSIINNFSVRGKKILPVSSLN
jgi:hypothetical protein